MPIEHKKQYGVYHWDTFDNETILMHEANDLETADKWVKEHYKGRISFDGADRVDIVDKNGLVVGKFYVR